MSVSAILKLQAAGFSADQVTALADLIDTQAASKSDLLEVQHSLEARMGDIQHGLEAKMGDVRSDVVSGKAEVLLMRWMIGFVLAFQVAIFAKMFVH